MPGDFAFGERVAENLPYPRSVSEKFVEMDGLSNSSSTHDRSVRAREDPGKMVSSRVFA